MYFHTAIYGGLIRGRSKFIIAIIYPFTFVYPATIIYPVSFVNLMGGFQPLFMYFGTFFLIFGFTPGVTFLWYGIPEHFIYPVFFPLQICFPYPVCFPFPFGYPVCTPYTPACMCVLRSSWKGCNIKTRICICSQRVWWDIFLQGYNSCNKVCFGSSCTGYGNINWNRNRLGGGMPFYPYKLGTACRHHNIVDGVCTTIDMESHTGRGIRIYFCSTAQCDASNNICVYTVCIIRCLQFCFRYLRIADNTNPKSSKYLVVRYFTVGSSGPCRIT